MLRESKRNNAAYRQEALACLGEFIGMRADSDLFAEVLEIIQPVIDDVLEESTEMDVDSTSGGLSSRPMYFHRHPWISRALTDCSTELSLAHALSSLLRSINPRLKKDKGGS